MTPAQLEGLALLAEECGEVVQVIGKSLRHGLLSFNPNGGVHSNRSLVAMEVGDVLAAVEILVREGVLLRAEIDQATASKLRRVGRYLHHIKVDP